MLRSIKEDLKSGFMASPLTVAYLLKNGYYNYPQKWKNENQDIQSLLDEVYKTGFAVIPSYYSPQKCAALRDHIDEIMVSNPQYVSNDNLIGDSRIFGAEKISAQVREFHEDKYLQKLSDLYYGVPSNPPFSLAARLEPNAINKDKDHGWHRDSMRRQFKAIIYLNDVEPENGPFQYITGSNHIMSMLSDGLTGSIPYASLSISPEAVRKICMANPERLKTVTGKAGTLILTDTTGIHRGSIIKSGYRYSMTNYYMYADEVGPHLADRFGPLAVRS